MVGRWAWQTGAMLPDEDGGLACAVWSVPWAQVRRCQEVPLMGQLRGRPEPGGASSCPPSPGCWVSLLPLQAPEEEEGEALGADGYAGLGGCARHCHHALPQYAGA